MFANKNLLALSVVALLTACGGGGSSAPATPAVTSFPVQKALATAYTNGVQNTLSVTGTVSNGTTSNALTGSLTFTLGKSSATTFNGVAALQDTATINGNLVANGVSLPFNSSSTVYMNANYGPIGQSVVGQYCVTTTDGVYPANATVGQTGNVYTFSCYTDSTKKVANGGVAVSYVTVAGSAANTLDVKLITSVYDIANKVTGSGATTYTITADGTPSLTRFEIITTANNVTLNILAQ